MSANAVRTGGVISASRNVPSPTGLRGILASFICPHHPLPREFSQRESLEGTARIAPYRSLPPRGRGTAIAVEGACAISIFAIVVFLRILPQSPSAPVSDPGHKHGLLPALAKNMPQAYFLNASRPPGGSLTHRRMSANTVQTGDSCRPWSDIAPYGSVGEMSRFRADCTVPKPPSEREGDRDSGGRSLRTFNIRNCCFFTHSPSVAFGTSALPEGA